MRARDAELIVADNEESAARRVAELLVDAARAGSEIALTGGSTPGRAYELAADFEPDWSGAGVWWGDERCVPPDDERSNFGLARRTLLDRSRLNRVDSTGSAARTNLPRQPPRTSRS